jgi:hypothetical protein
MPSLQRFLVRDCLGWGVLLWVVGYILGFALYPVVPTEMIGWYVMPLGLLITCLVLWRWVDVDDLMRATVLGAAWCAIAIGLDYLFIVKLLAPNDGYYKPDVYLYYASALLLPVGAAFLRRRVPAAP